MFLETFQGIYIYPNRTAVSKIQAGQKDMNTHTHTHIHSTSTTKRLLAKRLRKRM